MAKFHGFDERGAGRIVRAVRKIEGMQDPRLANQRGMRYLTPGIPFKNNTIEVIPAYACMRVTGIDAIRTDPVTVLVTKPDTTYSRDYLVNGALQVSPGAYGVAQFGPYVKLLHGTVFTQDSGYGPTPGQWYVSPFYPTHFTVIGIHDLGDFVSVARMGTPSFLLGQYETSVAQNASGSVQLLRSPTAGSEVEIPSWAVTGVNKFSAITGSAGDPEPVGLNWMNGRWYNWPVGTVSLAYGMAYFDTFASAQSAYSLTTFALLTVTTVTTLVNMASTTNGLQLSAGGVYSLTLTGISRGYTDEWWGTTGTTGQTYCDSLVKKFALTYNGAESESILYGDVMRYGGSFEPASLHLVVQAVRNCTEGSVVGAGAQVTNVNTALITLHDVKLKIIRLDI